MVDPAGSADELSIRLSDTAEEAATRHIVLQCPLKSKKHIDNNR